jgi:hypothetical protein
MMKPEELRTSEVSISESDVKVQGEAKSSHAAAKREGVRRGGAANARKGPTAESMALRKKAMRMSHRRQIRRSHANG